ncbi:hypothetical protein HanRHA438_Chr09g0410511 [Helianthus annuus]|uniref:Uncharacterized protein n=1 Tax=Helianthus annuus TaxID=4232 RepID=A0A9K3N917_HELAN|nr:hypothetical protein HanXRQr2_Chr09g0398731 [Helianthus annuus]KAJ0889217.1 hypothetical protein HanRHA438_Chr09g0410511 [Helianthus annuus]KAJ0894030.1 hypothetical protein HanPSC8_Chr09g0384501 [Helianthus annuus]
MEFDDHLTCSWSAVELINCMDCFLNGSSFCYFQMLLKRNQVIECPSI